MKKHSKQFYDKRYAIYVARYDGEVSRGGTPLEPKLSRSAFEDSWEFTKLLDSKTKSIGEDIIWNTFHEFDRGTLRTIHNEMNKVGIKVKRSDISNLTVKQHREIYKPQLDAYYNSKLKGVIPTEEASEVYATFFGSP